MAGGSGSGLSHPPLLQPWRYDIQEKHPPGGMLTRTRSMRYTIRHPVDEQTVADLRAGMDSKTFDALAASVGLYSAGPPRPARAALDAQQQHARPKRLVDTPGAVYKHVWAESPQPLGENTFRYTRRTGHEPKSIPPPRSSPQKLSQWFKEYGAPDPNVRFGRPTEFSPSVRLRGSGHDAFRTNVIHMRRGDLS